MIKYSETSDPTIIELEIFKKMNSFRRENMDEELTKSLLSIYMAKGLNIPDKEKPFLFQVIEKRLQYCYTMKIEDQRLILFLCALAETPGLAIMYLWYLQYWCFINDVKELNLELFCEKIFPMGFFSKSDLSKLWDEVKVLRTGDERGSDNLADYASAGMSIQFATA